MSAVLPRNSKHFLYAQMEEKPNASEKLDLHFRWGSYWIHVLRFHLTSFAPLKVIKKHL